MDNVPASGPLPPPCQPVVFAPFAFGGPPLALAGPYRAWHRPRDASVCSSQTRRGPRPAMFFCIACCYWKVAVLPNSFAWAPGIVGGERPPPAGSCAAATYLFGTSDAIPPHGTSIMHVQPRTRRRQAGSARRHCPAATRTRHSHCHAPWFMLRGGRCRQRLSGRTPRGWASLMPRPDPCGPGLSTVTPCQLFLSSCPCNRNACWFASDRAPGRGKAMTSPPPPPRALGALYS